MNYKAKHFEKFHTQTKNVERTKKKSVYKMKHLQKPNFEEMTTKHDDRIYEFELTIFLRGRSSSCMHA